MTFTPCTAHTWSDRGSLVGGIGMAAVALARSTALCRCVAAAAAATTRWALHTPGVRHPQLHQPAGADDAHPLGPQRPTPPKDGRVLIAGLGRERDADAQTAEIYDPVKKTFTATGPMVQCRGWHAATLLGDGRVSRPPAAWTAWASPAPAPSCSTPPPAASARRRTRCCMPAPTTRPRR